MRKFVDEIPDMKDSSLNIDLVEITPDADYNDGSLHIRHRDKLPTAKTGTTTLTFKIKDGVIVAADNRATMGIFVANKNAQKIHQILPYVYITIAGGVADALYLIELLKAETAIYNLRNEHKIGIEQTAHLLQTILYNKKGWYQVGHMIAGYRNKEGPKIFNLGGYGSLLEEDYCSVGSGSTFAYGVLETEWKEGLTAEEGKSLALKAIRSSIQRDIASGNGIDLVIIQKDKDPIEESFKITDKKLIDNQY